MNYIYADFNGCIGLPDDEGYTYMEITGFGTIKSLNTLQIKLKEGMRLIFYDPEDIEVEAEVYFDRTTPSIISSEGRWLAKFKDKDIKSCNKVEDWNAPHPCFHCREDFNPHLKKLGSNYHTNCPNCGTSVAYALSEP